MSAAGAPEMATQPDNCIVAIFGAGRNGSTLLGRLLDGSPGLWAHAPEINYLCAWDDLVADGELSIPVRQNTTTRALKRLNSVLPAAALVGEYRGHWEEIEDLYISNLVEPFERRRDPAAKLLRRDEWDVASFLPAFLEETRIAYASDTAPAKVTLFKTIETPYIDDYLRVFPGLRCLHIVRDPVDNFGSAKRTWSFNKHFSFYQFGHDQLETFLDARWLPHARSMLRLVAEQPDVHRIVRYEDLKADPASCIRAICGWLGVEPPAGSDHLTVLGGRAFRRMPSNPSQPGIEPPARVVADMAAAFGYTDVLSARERALIRHATTPLAEQLGYATTADTAPAGRLAGLRLWLRWLPIDDSERLNRRSRLRFIVEIVRRRMYLARLLSRRRQSV